MITADDHIHTFWKVLKCIPSFYLDSFKWFDKTFSQLENISMAVDVSFKVDFGYG